MSEQSHIHHRPGRRQLFADKPGEHRRPADRHQRGEPQRQLALQGRFGAKHQHQDRRNQNERLQQVQRLVAARGLARHHFRVNGDNHQHNRNVDQEHRSPVEMLQ